MADKKEDTKRPGVAFVPSDEQLYSVELMASIGISQDDIASALGIDPKTLRKHFAGQLAVGRTRTITKVADSLVRQALAGNMTAAIFFLKCQAGWRERDVAESPAGKKAQAAAAAATAGAGSDWGDDLRFEGDASKLN